MYLYSEGKQKIFDMFLYVIVDSLPREMAIWLVSRGVGVAVGYGLGMERFYPLKFVIDRFSN